MSSISRLKPFWTGLYMVSTVHAVCLGLYARRRHKFRNDFTYNKYHFGVFTQLMSALGIAAAGKLANPLVPGLLFLGAIGLASFPAYREGFREIRNEPDLDNEYIGMARRAGIYCLLAGWGVLFFKRRGSIPFLPPRINKKFTEHF